ncbi:MAG: zinc ribbon domain-containing protein [Firmicutes bacterium]|nr:zinc ribbon domain-containing protein [Bacillota bacterium]
MPIKVFKCDNCDAVFEEFIMSSRDNNPKCPACGSEKVKASFAGFTFSRRESSCDSGG